MKEDTKVNAGRRLARVEGQVRALRRMVDEDKYCIDIVRQVQAARAALASFESVIIDDHIQTCVHHAKLQIHGHNSVTTFKTQGKSLRTSSFNVMKLQPGNIMRTADSGRSKMQLLHMLVVQYTHGS